MEHLLPCFRAEGECISGGCNTPVWKRVKVALDKMDSMVLEGAVDVPCVVPHVQHFQAFN